MLEIIILYLLCSQMGALLRKKGRKPLWMQVAVVLIWIGSMLFAAMAYGVYLAIRYGPEATEKPGWVIYPLMIAAGVIGELILFGIAHLIPPKTPATPIADATYCTNEE